MPTIHQISNGPSLIKYQIGHANDKTTMYLLSVIIYRNKNWKRHIVPSDVNIIVILKKKQKWQTSDLATEWHTSDLLKRKVCGL